MVNKSEIVDIVQIIYFVPALFISIWICIRQGFRRESGWLFLVILSLARILGAAFNIAAYHNPSNNSLWIGTFVLSSMGAAFLVAAFTGIVNRIDTNAKLSPLTPRMRRYLQLMALASIILSIVGSTQNMRSLTEAAIILILIQFLASVYILTFAARNMQAVVTIDRVLVFICAGAAPFVLVRLIYSICAAFNGRNSATWGYLSITTTAIVLRAVLGTAMEIGAMTCYIIGGLRAGKLPKTSNDREQQVSTEQHKPDSNTYLMDERPYTSLPPQYDRQ